MKYILSNSYDPYHNLAQEEYIFKGIGQEEDILILWRNKPTIMIGIHQNTLEEINTDYVKENNINVARRITGGGSVYQDLQNLNFSIIAGYNKNKLIDFKTYTLPVINALAKLGVNAELQGRNDLTIEGKKFSGNAQSLYHGRILHHGTLLFNSDLNVLSKALNVKKDKIQSKGIKSVKSRVTNIKDYLKDDIDIEKFKELILKNMFETSNLEEYKLNEDDKIQIDKLKNEKYMTWEWNYGKSPNFNLKNSKRFSSGKIEVLLNIKKGIIEGCKIYGDFLALKSVKPFERKLQGIKYTNEEIRKVISQINISEYFGNMKEDEILECFLY